VPKLYFKSKLHLFICASLVAIPIFTFSLRLGGTLLLLASLFVWLFWARKQTYTMNQYQRWFLICSSALFLTSLLLLALASFPDQGGKDIAKYARLILAYPFMVLVVIVNPRQCWFWAGITIASLLCGVLALIDFTMFNQLRADAFGMFNPIFYANHALLFSYLSFLGFYWFRKNGLPQISWLCLVGSMSAIVGMLMTGSRGALVALPALTVLIVLYLFREKKFWLVGSFATITVISVAIIWQSQSLNLKSRLDLIPTEVDSYINQGNYLTSVGIRLYSWETAWHAFLEKPIIGHGPGNFKGLTFHSLLRDNYQVETNIYSHAHNEFLHTLATKGLVGLITLLGIFLVPLLAAVKLYREQEITYAFALAGTTLSFVCFGLTEMMLMKGSGATLYTFLIATFMSLGFCSISNRALPANKL
jgi:O-antigen ligase